VCFFPAFLHDLHFYLHRGAFMDKLKFRRRQHGRGRKNGEGDEKEMKELEKLERQEKKEGKSKLDD